MNTPTKPHTRRIMNGNWVKYFSLVLVLIGMIVAGVLAFGDVRGETRSNSEHDDRQDIAIDHNHASIQENKALIRNNGTGIARCEEREKAIEKHLNRIEENQGKINDKIDRLLERGGG